MRSVLEDLEVESYCKTSGATGLHVYVPLGAMYSYDDARQFAEIIVHLVQRRLPGVTSLIRDPQRRQGKVYLDYLQNIQGQTLAAAYSVRPRPGAPVSTPLKWDEVAPKLAPTDFTMRNIMSRLEKIGDIFRPVLGPGIDMEAALRRLEARGKREGGK
ncbi:MAG: hypothetical protein HY677_03095 [Chloroflexi bacterium]|nr:hypothetical protein [Chloroflexota bacterium]